MAEARVEIVSKITIKPSSPTPNHLKHFKISLLDQLSPSSYYVPMVLFYSTSHITKTSTSPTDDHEFANISEKLKTSLSEVLTLYYPFCGRIKGNKSNAYVDCNDEGVLYLEARIPLKLSDFLNNNSTLSNEIKGFLPLDPYNPKQENNDEYPSIMAVQVSEFGCGSVGIGVCISHKLCDANTIASFLQAWSKKAMGDGSEVASPAPPNMEASSLFPPKEIEFDISGGKTGEKNILTKRFLFSGNSLLILRDEVARGSNFKPTKVEAVTALIWKSVMEAASIADTAHRSSSCMVSHAVNIRSRMVPPLPQNSIGNLCQIAISPLLEVDKTMEAELHYLAEVVRETIRKVDGDYVSKLQGDAEGLQEVLKSLKEALFLVAKKGVPLYAFSSWVRFGFYETNFGWGKPTWVCTVGVPTRNVIILMPTRSGDGIEAWVTLNELHMLHFESNPKLLQFASSNF